MADEVLVPAGKTETTVREYDREGKLVKEHTTVITRMEPAAGDIPTGQYL